jgi:hypothetical protein
MEVGFGIIEGMEGCVYVCVCVCVCVCVGEEQLLANEAIASLRICKIGL